MIGKITDEESMNMIVTNGIIPAIYGVLNEKDRTVDSRVWSIGNLINTYNSYYLTGRSIDMPQKGESEE